MDVYLFPFFLVGWDDFRFPIYLCVSMQTEDPDKRPIEDQ